MGQGMVQMLAWFRESRQLAGNDVVDLKGQHGMRWDFSQFSQVQSVQSGDSLRFYLRIKGLGNMVFPGLAGSCNGKARAERPDVQKYHS